MDGVVRGPDVTRREWWAFTVVSAPAVISTTALLALVLALVFGRVSGGVVGGWGGWTAVGLWQQRPGGVQRAEADRPTRRSDRARLWTGGVLVGSDLAVADVVLTTGRLAVWAGWTALGLLGVHAVLLVRVAVVVRRRRRTPPPGYDDPRPPRPEELRWRAAPEPLRSVSTASAVLAVMAFVAAGVAVSSHRSPPGPGFFTAYAALGLAMALPGAVLALDLRGCAQVQARRVQLRRSTSRRPVLDEDLAGWGLRLRLVGALCAVLGLASAALGLSLR